MSSGTAAVLTPPPEPIPVFLIPELSPLAIEALRAAGLGKFFELNREDFTRLVSVIYVGFLERIAELRQKSARKKLFTMFCAEITMFLTAARPQWETLKLEKPEKSKVNENGLASEFLWNHVRKERLVAWQDYYSESRRNTKVIRLINDFVHFVVAKVFEEHEKAIFYISNEPNLRTARRRIQDINRGNEELKSV